MSNKIVLVGFMGSGKSIVAHKLGILLREDVFDMDSEVLCQTQCSDMVQLFQKYGEIRLREQEIQIGKLWRSLDSGIISTGGGVVQNKLVIDYLKQNNGVVVYLKAQFDTLLKRIQRDSTPRPLFSDRIKAKQLFNMRAPLYESYTDLIVQVDNKTVEQISEEIISHIQC